MAGSSIILRDHVEKKRFIDIPGGNSAIEVVFQDPFHLKNLYKFIFWWLIDNKYVDNGQGGKNAGTHEHELENLYSEIDRGGVKEYEFWWRCERKVHNPYFKYQMYIDYLGLGMRETEVVKDDKKYKMNIGEITIRLRGHMYYEGTGDWGKNFITKFFNDWFRKKWYAVKIEEHEDQLIEELYRLQEAIKQYLELGQWQDTQLQFFEPKGFE